MGEIVNIRLARKRKARANDAAIADANRAKHGRTKVQKAADVQEAARREALLDGVRRDRD